MKVAQSRFTRCVSQEQSIMANVCGSRLIVHQHQTFYYAYGNTPPEYLFPVNSTGGTTKQQLSVLCIGCGDLRSPLYSVHRDFADSPPPFITFTLNDLDPFVLARNLVILDMIRENVPIQTIWACWFSLGLTEGQYQTLEKHLQSLLLRKPSDFTNISVDDRCWSQLSVILENWIKWNPSLSVVQKWREHALVYPHTQPQETGGKSLNTIASQTALGRLQTHMMYCDPQQSVSEVTKHNLTGVTQLPEIKEGLVVRTNPTLLREPDKYNLHYGCSYPGAFPLFPLPPGKDAVVKHCSTQLQQWINTTRMHFDRIQWVFSVGDCLSISFPGTYDVISTSNVSDHVGLLPLLCHVRTYLHPKGVLLTATLLHLKYCESAEEYLQKSLIVDPSYWPSLFGLRCVGYEGQQAPVTSTVRYREPDIGALYLPSTGRSYYPFLWLPTHFNTTPTVFSGGTIPTLLQGCCSPPQTPIFGQRHLPTLLPVLQRVHQPTQYLTDLHDYEEILTLWQLLTRQVSLTDFVIVSIPYLPQEYFLGCDPTPVLHVIHNGHKFTSLWLTDNRIHWISKKLNREEYVVGLHSSNGLLRQFTVGKEVQQVPLQESELPYKLFDSDGHTEVVIEESVTEYKLSVSAGEVKKGKQAHQILLVDENGNKRVLELSMPFKHHTSGVLTKTVWNPHCEWYPDLGSPYFQFPKVSIVAVSGIQMTLHEKYLSRLPCTGYVTPPFVGMKDTIIVLLQQPEHFAFAIPSVHHPGQHNQVALGFRHGHRQDPATGTPMIDTSICILSPEKCGAVVPNFVKLSPQGYRISKCSNEEFELWKKFIPLWRQNMKTGAAVPHPKLPTWARPYFERVLIPPLFPTEADSATQSPSDLGMTTLKAKEKGNQAVKEGSFERALTLYETGVVSYYKTQTNKGGAVLCMLNIAHCLIQLAKGGKSTKERASEAVATCKAALELGDSELHSLLTKEQKGKVYYRMGLAYELLGHKRDSVQALNTALQFSPSNVDVTNALKRK